MRFGCKQSYTRFFAQTLMVLLLSREGRLQLDSDSGNSQNHQMDMVGLSCGTGELSQELYLIHLEVSWSSVLDFFLTVYFYE